MSTNQELSIKGTVSLEDFLKYNTYHSKTFTSIYFLISFIILWALGILFELPIPNDLLVWMIVSIPKAIQALILTILIFFALKKLLKRRATKEYESDQLLKTEINYKFNSEKITNK
ncbi:hypothetical protein SAMN05192533_1365 [Mesobacillus persicus]|uniref:Uncharacterized protein n=1 Tax=Mesobacillus persicus TaxID=930146 RepID=A0A1H8L0C0_9BACI|nr:hypothetical protein [Mesobacillus persicus]SEN98088.1 hypothetical protein SAMN05192533_1365 [Mesobacillus persicus]